MKRVQSPNPSVNRKKKEKANLFANSAPEDIEQMRTLSTKQDKQKVLLRIDSRTHVLVSPERATPEHAEKLRKRYKIDYDLPAKGGRKRK